MLGLLPSLGRAAVFNVASGDTAGLIAAIDAANANGEADTINLAAGTYTSVPSTSANVLPTITSEIAIVGAGAAATTIQRDPGLPPAAAPVNMILVAATGNLLLDKVTLRGMAAMFNGPAVASSGGRLRIVDSILTQNLSGGVVASGGVTEIVDSTLSDNGDPAGPFFDETNRGVEVSAGTLLVRGSQILGQRRTVAVSGNSVARIEDSVLSDGTLLVTTQAAGPMLVEIARAQIDGGTTAVEIRGLSKSAVRVFLTDTTITNAGRGIVVYQTGDVVLRRSAIIGSTQRAIQFGPDVIIGTPTASAASMAIEQSTISGNVVGIYVGTPLKKPSRIHVRASTVTNNGQGVAADFDEVDLTSSILAGNTTDCSGPLLSLGHNVIGSTAGCSVTTQGAGDVVGVTPQLGALAANGGPTPSHLPLPGSPALDAADPATCGGIDQRSYVRPVECDAGSIEANAAGPTTFLSDHFLCYTAKRSPGTTALPDVDGLSLTDDLESKTFKASKTAQLCTPAGTENGAASDQVAHLHGRAIKESAGEPRHVKQLGLRFVNQLGSVTVATTRPDLLLVPTAKDLTAAPPALDPLAHDVDDFKCYKVAALPGTPKFGTATAGPLLAVNDQFTRGRVVTLSKVSRVCASVDLDGAGRKNPAAYLVCYQARTLQPPLADDRDANIAGVYSTSAFGSERVDLKKGPEICVPSRRVN